MSGPFDHMEDPGEWRPGLPPIVGTAAHPSMRRKSVAQIRTALVAAREREASFRSMRPGPDVDQALKNERDLIAAYALALEWRGER